MDQKPIDGNPTKLADAALYHERQAKKTKVAKGKETFVLFKNKILKKTRMPNGNVHSVYIGTQEQADKAGIAYTKA